MGKCMLITAAVAALLAIGVYVGLQSLQREFPVHKQGAIVVTGASSGIGYHAAVELAKRDYVVFAGVRKQSDAEKLERKYPNLIPVFLDVTKPEQIQAAYDMVEAFVAEANTSFVGLVNNAGIDGHGLIEVVSVDFAKRVFDVNYFGTYATTQKFLPLVRQHKGRIVNVGSIAGLVSFAGYSIYCATKFALEAFTDSLRREMYPHGVSVSIIEPASIVSDFITSDAPDEERFLAVPKNVQEAYEPIHYGILQSRREAVAQAKSPQLTTDVIVHALLNKYPKTRYQVSTVADVPATAFMFIRSFIPDRLFDSLSMRDLIESAYRRSPQYMAEKSES